MTTRTWSKIADWYRVSKIRQIDAAKMLFVTPRHIRLIEHLQPPDDIELSPGGDEEDYIWKRKEIGMRYVNLMQARTYDSALRLLRKYRKEWNKDND